MIKCNVAVPWALIHWLNEIKSVNQKEIKSRMSMCVWEFLLFINEFDSSYEVIKVKNIRKTVLKTAMVH